MIDASLSLFVLCALLERSASDQSAAGSSNQSADKEPDEPAEKLTQDESMPETNDDAAAIGGTKKIQILMRRSNRRRPWPAMQKSRTFAARRRDRRKDHKYSKNLLT